MIFIVLPIGLGVIVVSFIVALFGSVWCSLSTKGKVILFMLLALGPPFVLGIMSLPSKPRTGTLIQHNLKVIDCEEYYKKYPWVKIKFDVCAERIDRIPIRLASDRNQRTF